MFFANLHITQIESSVVGGERARTVTFSISVSDDLSGVKEVHLCYSTDNGTSWTDNLMTLESNKYKTTIPEQPEGTLIKYYYETVDKANNRGQSSTYSLIIKTSVADFSSFLPVLLTILVAVGCVGLTIVLWKRRAGNSNKRLVQT